MKNVEEFSGKRSGGKEKKVHMSQHGFCMLPAGSRSALSSLNIDKYFPPCYIVTDRFLKIKSKKENR